MEQSTYKPLIDFTRYIDEHIDLFTGREWVFEAIDKWLTNPNRPQFFLLTGSPGNGKTAIASRLCQFSQGIISPPNGSEHLIPGFLSAVHFCSSRDYRWTNPHTFAESLALQLANRYPTYAKVLAEKKEEGSIKIQVDQQVQHLVNGQVTGIIIKSLNVSGISAEDAFNRVVREPLETMYREGFIDQIIILIDALDEALIKKENDVDIVSLLAHIEYIPAEVRFIVTSRPENDVALSLQNPRLKSISCSLTQEKDASHGQSDVEKYILAVLNKPSSLVDKLAPNLSPTTFSNTLQEKSAGNFLYVKYLLMMLEGQQGKITQKMLDTFPPELDGIYMEFLDRLLKNEKKSWKKRYAPIFGTLSIARQPLTEDQLAGINELELSQARRSLIMLLQFLVTNDKLPLNQRSYTLYHNSFADFLLDENRAQYYWCEPAQQHMRIANYFYVTYGDDWLGCGDNYALSYTMVHLQAAVQLAYRPSQKIMHGKAERLFNELQMNKDLSTAQWLANETRDFIGREWVFHMLNTWLSDPGSPRVFLLIGEPGMGKTMLAKQLMRIVYGAVSPDSYPFLSQENILAFHFCRYSERDPRIFVVSLAQQFAKYCQPFSRALDQMESSLNISTTGSVINPKEIKIKGRGIEYIPVRDLIHMLIYEPLNHLAKTGLNKTLLILIDALDESWVSSEDNDIVSLLKDFIEASTYLPLKIRFLLTSRPYPDVFDTIGKSYQQLYLSDDAQNNKYDLYAYVDQRLSGLPESQKKALTERILEASEGNLMFTRYLLDDLLLDQNYYFIDDLGNIKRRSMSDIYSRFLKQNLSAVQERHKELFITLLGILAVAREEGLTRDQLAAITGSSPSSVGEVLQACSRFLGSSQPDGPFQFFHVSFRDFLLANDAYPIDPVRANHSIAIFFLSKYEGNWLNCEDDYAIQYTPSHLIAVMQEDDYEHSHQELLTHLFGLLTDLTYLTKRLQLEKGSVASLKQDLLNACGVLPPGSDRELLSTYAEIFHREDHVLRNHPDNPGLQLQNILYRDNDKLTD